VIGACVGAGAVSIIGWLGEVALKKEAMGFGDVTLMAVVGGAVGPARALLVLFVGAALGAVVFSLVVYPLVRLRRARQPAVAEGPLDEATDDMPHVPFGVFLAPAAVLTLLWGDPLITWYLNRLVP
jgi:leader peptidase (prepilin peptidase) / N-methyltransferase